jgi:hypothetical protein
LNIDLGGPQSWGPGQDLLVYDPTIPTWAIIYSTPAFLRMYWRAQQELVNGPLNINLYTGPLMNAKYNAFCRQRPERGKSQFGHSALDFCGPSQHCLATGRGQCHQLRVNPAVTVSNDVAYVSGVAPVAVETVWINGEAWPITWTTLTNWTLAVPLHSGTNQFNVAGISPRQWPIAGDTGSVSVVYNGTIPSPVGQVVINEIMYAIPWCRTRLCRVVQ